ncbi:MAG: hypothetical protein J7452_04350 [Thermoflexus sp.]|nr:hypothetical protein [Thermoflexus sp.]
MAREIAQLGPADLAFCGEESSDGATGQLPLGLAEWLGFHQTTPVTKIKLDLWRRVVRGRQERPGGHEIPQVHLPAAVSMKIGSNEPRFMEHWRRPRSFAPGQVTVWRTAEPEVDETFVGTPGSPTQVSGRA